MPGNDTLVLALPKGRILRELTPLLRRAGIEPEPGFADEAARQLRFATNHAALEIIRVRGFDVATFVAFGAAQLGVAGNDIVMEFDYPELYAPVDLGIGKCRLYHRVRREYVTKPLSMDPGHGLPYGGIPNIHPSAYHMLQTRSNGLERPLDLVDRKMRLRLRILSADHA